MNPLVKKEIRLLLPGAGGVLLLETLLPWVYQDADYVFSFTPVAFFLGLIILTVDAFGREFSLGTFQSLMSQPIERRKIWRTKITLLLLAAGLISLAYAASCGLRVHNAITARDSVWLYNAGIIRADFHNAMLASTALLLVAMTGGLWTSLLLRQTASAFWVTFLCPCTLALAVGLCLPSTLAADNHLVIGLFYSLAVLYSLGGFWLAYRLFHRAQDVGWSGGVISFSRWRYFESGTQEVVLRRGYRPWTALFKKELQLHSVSLFCAAGLLAVHLGVFIVRALYGRFHGDSMVNVFTHGFWIFWLVLPAVIGCTAVAEERKLGVMDGQFCLPASRRRQFAAKFLPAFLLATFLGGVMPLLLELMAGHFGIPNEFFRPDLHRGGGSDLVDGYLLFLGSVIALAMGLFWLGLQASTLTKSFIQALSSTIAGGGFVLALAAWASNHCTLVTPLPLLIGVPVGLGMLLWLIWRNFNRYQEGWRVWRHNILGVIGATIFIIATSEAVYHRAWEAFEPAEPPHGSAIFTLADPPRVKVKGSGDLSVQWPDGRIWYDTLGYSGYWHFIGLSSWRDELGELLRPAPISCGPRQFAAGSNWVSLDTQPVAYWDSEGDQARIRGYLDTVGIQRDGTLWISRETKPGMWNGADMQQVGKETDWRQVVRWQNSFALLKTNGTLWWWSFTNNFTKGWWHDDWPTVRGHPIRQMGTNANWQELARDNGWVCHARRADGTTWFLSSPVGYLPPELVRETNFDQVVFETFSKTWHGYQAFVGKDGTLRVSIETNGRGYPGFQPVGVETNWLAVMVYYDWMVALKRDGTLWKWNLPKNWNQSGGAKKPSETAASYASFYSQPPVRLGIHDDWVALGGTWNCVVSLAADGSLWGWPGTDAYEFALMKPPKQPQLLDRVF